MKPKFAFVFVLVITLFLAVHVEANATVIPAHESQTVITPIPYQPMVPISNDCEEDGYQIPSSCMPGEANQWQRLMQGQEPLPGDLSSATYAQADELTWQQAVEWTFIREQVDLFMFSDSDGWFVGEGGDIIRWNGSSTQYYGIPSVTSRFNAIDMVSQTDGWIVGNQGIILHWDGTAWQQAASPTTLTLRNIDMVSASEGWIVGGDAPNNLILHWDGSTWSPWTVPDGSGGILLDIDMLTPTDGWIVGALPGTILHWDGSTWQKVISPTAGYLNAVDMVSANDGWAVGNSGSYQSGFITHWNGSEWQIVPPPSGIYEFEQIDMVSANEGWATSWYGGALAHWDGVAWTDVDVSGIHSVQMLSETNGWAVGRSLYHYTTFTGLAVHVDNANGQPASGARVYVKTLDGNSVVNGYGNTDASGNVLLSISPGSYHIMVFSTSEHFGLYQLNITSPSTVNLTAADTPAIVLTAKRRDGMALDQADIRVVLSTGPLYSSLYLGRVDANGQMTFHITPGTYDVNAYDVVNYYDLLKRQQLFSGASGILDFDMSTNPSAEIVISSPEEDSTTVYLSHAGKLYSTYFGEVADGTRIILSANEVYVATQEIRKSATDGAMWHYSLRMDRPDLTFGAGESFAFSAGGALNAVGRSEPASLGDYVRLADMRDSFGNVMTSIYIVEADETWGGYVEPYIHLTDPNGAWAVLESTGYYIPLTAPTGWYKVHYDWETGPYQGLVVADSSFDVRPLETSAIIPTDGGVLTSTYDNTSYFFASGIFTDTVIVTHTVRLTNIPSSGELADLPGHTFNITAVYSSTGQPAEPTQPYTMTVYYTDEEIRTMIEDTLALYYWDGSQWVRELTSIVNAADNTITANPGHFSLWTVLGDARRMFIPFINR